MLCDNKLIGLQKAIFMSPLPPAETLNLAGLYCPLPILRTKKALAGLNPGEVIEIICTDPATPVDFTDFCTRSGNILLRQWQEMDTFYFLIQKR
jgi:tRNA 2-thiouridine synthesizing protein A